MDNNKTFDDWRGFIEGKYEPKPIEDDLRAMESDWNAVGTAFSEVLFSFNNKTNEKF